MARILCTPAGRLWLAIGLLLGVGAHPLAAQTTPADSTTIRYEEEALPTPAAAPGAAPSRLQVQERHLWKLGLNNLFFLPADGVREFTTVPRAVRYGRYGLHLAYERKLAAPWAVLAELSPYLLDYAPPGAAAPSVVLCARAQVAGRYYYNLARRLRLGKPAGNFSGNYFALALGAGLGQSAHETAFFFYKESGPFARFDGALLYGLQRRLGRYGFADFNAGIPFAFSHGATTTTFYPNFGGPTLAVNLRIGLCLGR
jgi:hypothetical protein